MIRCEQDKTNVTHSSTSFHDIFIGIVDVACIIHASDRQLIASFGDASCEAI